MLFVFISIAPQEVFVSLFLPFILFQGIGGSTESEWGCETGRRHKAGQELQTSSVCRSVCFQLSVCGSFVKKVGLVVPFVLQCLLWFVLNGMQMWFIVHGMMQSEKTGLYETMQTWAGNCVWAECSCGWWRSNLEWLMVGLGGNNTWTVVLHKEGGFLPWDLWQQS